MGLPSTLLEEEPWDLAGLQPRQISHFPSNSVLCLYSSYNFRLQPDRENTALTVQEQATLYVLFIHIKCCCCCNGINQDLICDINIGIKLLSGLHQEKKLGITATVLRMTIMMQKIYMKFTISAKILKLNILISLPISSLDDYHLLIYNTHHKAWQFGLWKWICGGFDAVWWNSCII